MLKRIIKRLLAFLLPHVPWHKAVAIVRRCRLARKRVGLLVATYFLGSTVGALLDGAAMILLVELITGKLSMTGDAVSNPVVTFLLGLMPFDASLVPVYLTALGLFLMRAVLLFLTHLLDGYLQAKARQVLQQSGIHAILRGDWEYVRDIRVGQRVGAITEEALHVAQFFMAILRTLQGLLLATVMALLAMSVSWLSALVFIAIGLPVLFVLRRLFAKQSLFSERLMRERQGFYAAITERISGLFQVKVDDRLDAHLRDALAHQHRLTGLEIGLWRLRASVTAMNALIPAIVLMLFYLASLLMRQPLHEMLYLLAGVGALGLRTLNYVNAATGNISSITAVAGSIGPVYEVLTIPEQLGKERIDEPICGLETHAISYAFVGRPVLRAISTAADLSGPLVIRGPSGSGKTTLANILAGLYKPQDGQVVYVGASGKRYDSAKYKPRVGYVAQDIHIFNDTVRANLVDASDAVGDETLWRHLESVGARTFVERLGGLDALLSEAGRSLSGGERRRLGIARILARQPNLLILDEVSSGLDDARKRELEGTIDDLARRIVTIVITHDPLHFADCAVCDVPLLG